MIDIRNLNGRQKFGLVLMLVSVIAAAMLNSVYVPEEVYLPLQLAIIPAAIGGVVGAAIIEPDRHFWFQASLSGVLANLGGLISCHFYLMWRSIEVYKIEIALALILGMLPGLMAYRMLKKSHS